MVGVPYTDFKHCVYWPIYFFHLAGLAVLLQAVSAGRNPHYCQCILTVHHILVECNHFDQERKYIFGRRDVESLRFHPTLILAVLKECQFYYQF